MFIIYENIYGAEYDVIFCQPELQNGFVIFLSEV